MPKTSPRQPKTIGRVMHQHEQGIVGRPKMTGPLLANALHISWRRRSKRR